MKKLCNNLASKLNTKNPKPKELKKPIAKVLRSIEASRTRSGDAKPGPSLDGHLKKNLRTLIVPLQETGELKFKHSFNNSPVYSDLTPSEFWVVSNLVLNNLLFI